MAYKVIPAAPFLKELKNLMKRYPSLKEDVLLLAEKLETNPEMGQALGGNLFNPDNALEIRSESLKCKKSVPYIRNS